jgi:Flp pilus assembly pilin Flp
MKLDIKNEAGASLVEYALLVSLIAVIVIPAVRITGKNTKCIFEVASAGMDSIGNQPFNPVLAKQDCDASGG